MRSPRFARRACWSLLFAGLFLRAPLAVGQESSLSSPSHLTPEVRSRLADAAQNPALAPWQRDYMLEVAGGATETPPALPGLATPPVGATTADDAWSPAAMTPPLPARAGHTAIYDPVRDRMVVFGGSSDGIALRNDVWALTLSDPPTWTQLAPTGTPPTAPYDHTAIYDPVRDRMVVFGGRPDLSSYNGSNGVWALTLSGTPAWTPLAPTGAPPVARSGHTAIYDPVRDRMVVFGGIDGNGYPSSSYPNDTWALTLSGTPAWTLLTPTGTPPVGRYRHSAIYDPVRDRMVVFGGFGQIYGSARNDTWTLTLSGTPAWTPLTANGTPSARYGHTAIYDPVRDRMVVFGGTQGDFYAPFNDFNNVLALKFSGDPAWIALSPTGTPQRFDATATYDPIRDRMVAFGGYTAYGNTRSYLNDVRALALSGTPAWTLVGDSSPPAPRRLHSAIYDPVRDRMVVFGGFGPSARNDLWALTLSGTPAWTPLASTGTPPSPRYGHSAIYDPVRDRMVVFGGSVSGGGTLNDLWALTLSGTPIWTQLVPTGVPPTPRDDHTAIYDPVGDRMVVFGGEHSLVVYDQWALTLSGTPNWTHLIPNGTPPTNRWGHSAIYDPLRQRMVVFGGYGGGGLNEAWELMLSDPPAWTQLAPTGTLPGARVEHTAIYDPVRDRMVVYGNEGPGANDVWALTLSGTPLWTPLAPAGGPPPARYGHTAIYDPLRDRMVVFGGDGDGNNFNDAWALTWGTPLAVDGDARGRIQMGVVRPNPARGVTFVDFELREPARVVLDVFDTQGRRVRRIADGWFPAGRHASAWRGDDDQGHALESGVYLVRMRQGSFQATRRIVRVR